MEKIIIVENLYKVFGPSPEEIIPMLQAGKTKNEIMDQTKHGIGVANATFSVQSGEILVVMGLSGSGKSTLVRCINRLIEPTAGRVIVEGQDVCELNTRALRKFRQKHFGMVFQNFALLPHRSVVRNVEYGLEVQKIDAPTRYRRAMEALEQVGLKGWEESMPAQLSGGMQQRVGLARALALDADIMLMDEAFSALDPLIRKNMQDELLSLQEDVQKTIIFISHDLDEALKLGDRIVLMKDGAIVQQGTAEEILTNPANEYVEKFVEEVDMTKVLTAESVMVDYGEMAKAKTDGPRAALHKMRKLKTSSIFVSRNRKLEGIVFADDASKSLERGENSLEHIIKTDILTVAPDTVAKDLFPLIAKLSYPLAVVDEKRHLKGIVVKGALLGALSENKSV